ncbi:MAG: HAMP domain-containing histidine kinase [Thermoplasmata archaeon]|nr:HAMP domain-containing histidine kinase [Thermoplasmata archaeon]
MQETLNDVELSVATGSESIRVPLSDMADILELIARVEPLDLLLDRIATAIKDRFAIKSLTICLLDDETGYFKPVTVKGFVDDQAKAIKGHAYTLERKRDEFQEKFRISKDCYYIRAEELTSLYNDDVDYIQNVSELGGPRESRNEWHDLDYIDFLMKDRLGNLIGWIEIDEPQNRLSLSPEAIGRIRIMSNLAGIAVENSRMYDDAIGAMNESQGYLDLIAHDIGNIVEPILCHLDSLKGNSRLSEADNAKLEKAVALANEAKSLIHNVRRMSEVRSAISVTKTEYDLKHVLVKCISSIQKDHPEKDIVVDFDCSYEKCLVIADDLVSDLFANLLGNAAKFSNGNQAEIEVTVSNGHSAWIVRIDDHGVGIPDDKKELVFSRFAAHPANHGSSGLGLSIVGHLVERYNGIVTLRDRVKGDYAKGASFEVALPKAKVR